MSVLRRVKRWGLDIRTRLRFGTLNPESVVLPGSDRPIFLDPHDRRARKKLVWETVRGRRGRNRVIWCAAAACIRPTLVADVGLNYGECLFSATYPDARRIIGVEANPALLPFARRTLVRHPDAARIELVNALAGDEEGGERAFFVNRDWSGGSTPVAGVADRAPGRYREEQVETVRVAQLFADAHDTDRLLFKVDVEGFEPQVLRGMETLLERVGSALGYVEFDHGFLAAAGASPGQFVAWLLQRFAVHRFARDGTLTAVEEAAALDRPGLHTDLLLAAGPGTAEVVAQLAQTGAR